MVAAIYKAAKRKYGAQVVNDWLADDYYIVPPEVPTVICPICHASVNLLGLARHIPNHRGKYQCYLPACQGKSNRFDTARGLRVHIVKTHTKDKP